MTGFLYYLPRTIEPPEHLTGEPMSRCGVSRGPDGAPGTLIVPDCDAMPRFRVDLAAQTWMQCGAWWLGYETAAPPTASLLRRAQQIAGHAVTLGDGGAWVVPLAVVVQFVEDRITRGTHLPQSLRLGAEGQWVSQILPQYLGVSHAAEQMYQHLIGQGPAPSVAEAASIAADALSVNYRVTAWECSALGLLTTENLADVLRALVDWPVIEAWLAEKKRTLDDAAISPGEAA